MTPTRYRRIKELFLEAAAKAPADRARYLELACQADPFLKSEVESLLAQHDASQSKGFVDKSGPSTFATDQTGPSVPVEELLGMAVSAAARRGIDLTPSDSHVAASRFPPGTLLAGRFRIIELLGRGGMGEVYRADDLKLGQCVALKFLPRTVASDRAWLDRLFSEVRIARQVTHANVCRVYDIDEVNGEHCISMEYVDGEDLASLLRRIGRLTEDKALEIARQLCQGLASAHERGVLHRDLKPANIMIDGRGHVRINDFGLAVPIEQLRKREARAGTPAYMAPEQWSGRDVSTRSDVYALGLVLYELFTGVQAFEADTVDQYGRLHAEHMPPAPIDLVPDLNPQISGVIMQCLAKNPAHRPRSALSVAALLPGGDPLEAMRAAGKTPSPEMVAAAGDAGVLERRLALWCLGWIVVGILICSFIAREAFLLPQLPTPQPRQVLMHSATVLLDELGLYDEMADSAYGFAHDARVVRFISQNLPADGWDLLGRKELAVMYFWYRQSSDTMRPLNALAAVNEYDPPLSRPAMATVRLDGQGRLLSLAAVPRRDSAMPVVLAADPIPPAPPEPDWATVFKSAGLALGEYTPATPSFQPAVPCDLKRAWVLATPTPTLGRTWIEAGATNGQVVYFAVKGPWDQAGVVSEPTWIVPEIFSAIVLVVTMLGGSALAHYNWRQGRGDRRGAMRVGAFMFATVLIAMLLQASHVPSIAGEIQVLGLCLGTALSAAAVIWVFYVAAEPYVRRVWPDMLISWTRLLVGQWNNPRVGRDSLVGIAGGVFAVLVVQLDTLLPRWLGNPGHQPFAFADARFDFLAGPASTIAVALNCLNASVYIAMFYALLLLLPYIAFRHRLIAGAVFVLVTSVTSSLHSESMLSTWLLMVVLLSVAALVITRFGLLGLITGYLTYTLLVVFPLGVDLTAWHVAPTLLGLAIVAGLAGLSFWISLGGQPLFKRLEIQ